MSAVVPPSHRDLLDRPICASLATLMPSGQPQLSSVWFDYDGTYVRIPTVRGRRKERNMRERPQVSLLIVDPDNPYRYLELRGEVDEITDQDAFAHLQQVTLAYTGQPNFYGAVAPAELEGNEERVICKIRPTHVTTFGQGVERKEDVPELNQYRR